MNYFPLSYSQKNILNLEKAYHGTSVNHICATIRVQGDLEFNLLQESIHFVLEHDSTMGTRLVKRDGEMFQYYEKYSKEDFPVYDFSNVSAEGFKQWEQAVTREPFALDGPLYRICLFKDGEGKGGFIINLHHIIADGWSMIHLCNRICDTYSALYEKKPVLNTDSPNYEEHVREEQEYFNSRACVKDEQYWREILNKGGEPAVLKSVSSAAISPVGNRKSYELPQRLNHAIHTYCQKHRMAPFAVFYMALAVYLKRIGGTGRFAIGVPILNRTNFKWKQTSGMFVTTLPFYNEISEEWTFDEFGEKFRENWYEMLRHQRYPFSKIHDLAGGGDGRLFHVALSYQDGQFKSNRNNAVTFTGKWHYCGYQAEQLTIHLTNLFHHQQYAVDYDYQVQFFTENEIERLHNNLCEIMTCALNAPETPLKKLPVLSVDQREQLIYTFNRTERYLKECSVYEALLENNRECMKQVALICEKERVTYQELFYAAAGYEAALRKNGVKEEDLIAILLPRKKELFMAMTGILKAGCAYMILSGELPDERIRRILNKSGARAVITDADNAHRVQGCTGTVLCKEQISPIEEDAAVRTFFYETEENPGEKLAYVVYTSGSTGEPKGVEITQRNLLNLSQEMHDIYGDGAVLSVCNIGFDAFMLESIVALLNGKTIILPKEEDLEAPAGLAELMTGYRAGSLFITPSRLNVFLLNEKFCSALKRMECIVCGGEAFPTELLKKIKKYSKTKIYNQYGPSETTVAVSFRELSGADKITAGHPMGNCRLYVLDKWLNPVPAGCYGNLYVAGACVGRGYRNAPELTDRVFMDNPFESDERMYATGDIAYWTNDGEIVLVGREDNQIKLHGLRVELQEIGACLETYPGIRSAMAVVMKRGNQQILGAYYCGEAISEAELLIHTATYLPKYMIPSYIMHLDEFPVSANGKVDMKKLPLPKLNQRPEKEGMTETESSILDIFRQVLHTDEIQVENDYFLFGGNSLNAMETLMKIEEKTGRRIRVADLYACRTACKVAAYIDGTQAQGHTAVKRFKKAGMKTEYPLSPAQQGMYIQSVLDIDGLSYNMPGAFLLEEEPDAEKLEKAFLDLIEKEPVLRTSYEQGAAGLCAKIHDKAEFTLEKLEADSFEEAGKKFLRPFDLSRCPLLRAGLWKSAEGWHLFVDTHHIIGDGMSTPLLLQRLDLAYQGNLTCPEWNYYDYIDSLSQEQIGKQEELRYWMEHLKDLPEILRLPGDYPDKGNFDYKGTDYEYVLSKEKTIQYRDFCHKKGISEFVLFQAAYGILLSKLTGRSDFVIGAPAAGRTTEEMTGIIGPFINTMPIRLKPEPESAVGRWLETVQDEVTGVLDNQHVSLEDIIQALHLPRGARNALYRVMITQSPVDEDAFYLDGRKMKFRPISTGSAKMDLILDLSGKGDSYTLRFSYADGIFVKETIELYARSMEHILDQLIAGENRKLRDIDVLSEEDEQRYVRIPNETKTAFDDTPVHNLLRDVAVRKKDETAVIFHHEEYSYSWVEKRANAIAHFISEKGCEPGSPVALCMSRTPDMIAAMYGILKAGCAYVFMLPSFPAARMSYMMDITDAALLFYDEAAVRKMPEEFLEELPYGKAHRLPDGYRDEFENLPVKKDDLVNVLFTSGSTGKPKGVMLRHHSVSNLYDQMKTLLEQIEGRVLCSTNSVFDCFVVETIIALALGRCVVLADEEEMMLPWKLAELVERYRTGIFEMTPSRLQMCLGNDEFCKAAKYIRIVLLGGEVVTKTLLEKYYEYTDGVLMNMYGPTEATVFTTMEPLRSGEHITIGKPLQNTRTYVLDENLRPVPPTACGELYIAGDCLAAGYIGRPELTAGSFTDDIYFPGEKMYKSGDLVRLRADGRFDYIGRKDAQVKLNGQRVELGEITGAVLESGYAAQAAVVPVRKDDGSMELCAFYEAENPQMEKDAEEQIQAHLRKVLPVYMIPSRIYRVEKMPMTATCKIDMQTLKKMAEETDAAVIEETLLRDCAKQQPGTIDYIFSVWNEVLSVPAADENASFFELGGTSMAALNVLSRYFNDHLEMTLSQFYENPTARAQMQLLYPQSAENEKQKKSKKENRFHEVEKAVLVTGATGFFGIHLVKELLDQNKQVICLLRDGSRERVLETVEWYFGADHKIRIENLSVVKGDIAVKQLGMPEMEYKKLVNRVGEIYHSAADVRHYAADEKAYLAANVDGTGNMLALAEAADAAFYHMSTCSVAGERLKHSEEPCIFTEKDYDVGQNWEDNIYVRSKFLAEGLVLKAGEKGLKTKIFRLGRLVGRASDGKFQKNAQTNAFYLNVRAFCQLGAVPQQMTELPIDLMPIDVAAKEVLALTKGNIPICHIMSHKPPRFIDVMKAADDTIKVVSMEELQQILVEKKNSVEKSLLPFLMEQFHQAAKGGTQIAVVNRMTMEQLETLGFSPDIPGPEQLLKGF